MRPLTLHASALNDDEYNLYTTSILDLALYDSNHLNSSRTRDDTFYEQISVNVRETRAWLRGRYPDVQVSNIDAILKFFTPTLSQRDILSGGQFFAALRLVVHVQTGSEVDRSLAFVQARLPSTAGTSSGAKPCSDPGAPQLPRRSEHPSTQPSISENVPSPFVNPFSYEAGQHPPLHPSQRQDVDKAVHSPNNPFLGRSKSISSRSEDGSSRIPPLPPRKPSAPIPPPRHAPISPPQPTRLLPPTTHTSRTSPTSTSRPQPPVHPPLPPKPKAVTHVTSTLMKQSLQASKTAQTMKKAEEQLERERVLQVLRSSAVISGAHVRPPGFSPGNRSPSKRVPTPPVSISLASSSTVAKSDSSASGSGSDDRGRERPPLPRRRHAQQQPSPPVSISSLEQVALAVAPSGGVSQTHSPYASSPFESPTHSPRSRQALELPGVAGLPPPTHPDRKQSHHHIYSIFTDDVLPASNSSFDRNLESFEAVYGTGSQTPPTTSSLSADTPTPLSPTSEDLTSSSPQQRMHRSKSLHQHPHPNIPPPPPARRRRPESMQLLSNGEALFGTGPSPRSASAATSTLTFDSNNALKNSMSHTPPSHRRSSYSSSFGGTASSSTALGTGASGNGMTSGSDMIQRRIAELQLRAENAIPVLEKARYKAEAGLSRRGFIQGSSSSNGSGTTGQRSRSRGGTVGSVREDREGLMSEYQYDAEHGDAHGDADEEYGGDDDGGSGLCPESGDEKDSRGNRNRVDMMERDALKWPAGEGWKML